MCATIGAGVLVEGFVDLLAEIDGSLVLVDYKTDRLGEDDPAAREMGDMILTALERNPLFVAAALPLRVG